MHEVNFGRIDSSSIGSNKSLTANSCNHIKTIGCSSKKHTSGVYWVWREQPIQVNLMNSYAMSCIRCWYLTRFTAICLLIVEDGHLYGNIHILKHHLSPLICTISQITTRAVLPMTVDGAIYPIRNVSIQLNRW